MTEPIDDRGPTHPVKPIATDEYGRIVPMIQEEQEARWDALTRTLNDISAYRGTTMNGHFTDRNEFDDWFNDVLKFHRKFQCTIGDRPGEPSEGDVWLRVDLIREEYEELVGAMNHGDIPGIADGAVDLIYVVLGTLVSYGIDPRPIWDRVHAANMAKEGGGTRSDGKIMKPPGWVAPDVEEALINQGWSGPAVAE